MKLTKKQKKEILEDIGRGEWWKSDNKLFIEGKVKELMECGYSFKKAKEFVWDIVVGTRNEYGE